MKLETFLFSIFIVAVIAFLCIIMFSVGSGKQLYLKEIYGIEASFLEALNFNIHRLEK